MLASPLVPPPPPVRGGAPRLGGRALADETREGAAILAPPPRVPGPTAATPTAKPGGCLHCCKRPDPLGTPLSRSRRSRGVPPPTSPPSTPVPLRPLSFPTDATLRVRRAASQPAGRLAARVAARTRGGGGKGVCRLLCERLSQRSGPAACGCGRGPLAARVSGGRAAGRGCSLRGRSFVRIFFFPFLRPPPRRPPPRRARRAHPFFHTPGRVARGSRHRPRAALGGGVSH